jgi:hypothetical protein
MEKYDTMKKWTAAVIALVVVSLAVANNSYGKQDPVVKKLTTLGTAVIHDKDMVAGRKNAVDDALASAVSQVVVEMLTGETVVRRFKLINDNLLKKQQTYIQNYRVLTESVSGNMIRVLVEVDVSADRVSRDLSQMGLALAGTVYPRIVFMVAEKRAVDDNFSFWWGERRLHQRTASEKAMVRTLSSAGFDIIATPALNKPLGLPVTVPKAQMMALAEQLGADILIVGQGAATEASNTMGGEISAYEAIVAVKALRVPNGIVVGQAKQKNVVSSKDTYQGRLQALDGAGELAGDALMRQIMIAWQQEQERSAVIQVVVEGTGGHIASFVRLRTAIATLSGVKELKMQEMSADRASMAVNYQGSTHSLADALLLKTFSGFGIDIHELTSEAIHIRLVH